MKILGVIAAAALASLVIGCAATTPAAPPAADPHGLTAGPNWRSAYQCFTDDGYGRYRHCDEIQ